MKKAKQVLNDRGLRVTNQRTLIFEAIRHSHGHVDADEVYRNIHRKQPRISLSTVYRTLQRFKELGLIDELHFAQEHHHYELKPAVGHYHLVCLECGQIIEFEYPLVSLVKKNVPEAQTFKITGSEITFTGYCSKCQMKKNMSSRAIERR
jgi:Fur family ferric uptake transcriptional regulator